MLRRPKLWWPNGLGDPYLYRASLSLIQQGKPIDTIEFDYGIRTIRRLPSAGPQTQDRWADWQFVVNDRKFFVKGMDWWTNDIFLDLPREPLPVGPAIGAGGRHPNDGAHGAEGLSRRTTSTSCAISSASWFGKISPSAIGTLPTGRRTFGRSRCCTTSSASGTIHRWPLYCGGNEFNPYTVGNTATIGILERSVNDFDGTRFVLRATPDRGDIHAYPGYGPNLVQAHLFRSCPISASSVLIPCPKLAPYESS